MNGTIHCILPSHCSCNFLPALLDWANSYSIQLEFSIEERKCTLKESLNFTASLLFKLELARYTSLKSQICWEGYCFKTLVEKTNLKYSKPSSSALVINLAEHLRVVPAIFSNKFFKSNVLPVYGEIDNVTHPTSIIARRGSLVESYIAYLSKVVFDAVRQLPSGGETMSFSGKVLNVFNIINWLVFQFGKLNRSFVNNWSIAWRKGKEKKWNLISKGKNIIEADPFLVKEKGVLYCFYERMEKKGKGAIYVKTFENDSWSVGKEVLQEEFHLSYPFIWEQSGNWFMMPESADNKDLRLYKASNFPLKWDYLKSPIQGFHLYDSTLIRLKEQDFLLANIGFPGLSSPNDELYILPIKHSILNVEESLNVPLLPVIADVRKARNGGKTIVVGENHFRFGQMNTPYYGKNIRLFRLLKQGEDSYIEEETSLDLQLPAHFKGVHTYASAGEIECIDTLL